MEPSAVYHQEALQQAHVDIARLQEQVSNLRRDVDDLRSAIHTLTSTISAMNTTLSEARGGWKLMMLLGGGAATFGSVITWVLTQWRGHP